MSEATPRPWNVNALAIYHSAYPICVLLTGEHDRWIGKNPIGRECAAANAALIVRAVNAHDALVAACEAILETNGLTDKESEAREKASSALALARGE